MRAHEFIIETPQEDKILIKLAAIVYSKVKTVKNKGKTNLGTLQSFIEKLPEADKEFIGNKLNNIKLVATDPPAINKYMKSMDIEIPGDTGAQTPLAFWQSMSSPGDDELYGMIVINNQVSNQPDMQSTLAHELRHALDDANSSSRASVSYGYDQPKKKEHRSGGLSYVAKPAEINARFVQAMEIMHRGIPLAYKFPPDEIKSKLKQYLKYAFKKLYIAQLFPEKEQSRDYKQLIKRGMAFIQQEMKTYEEYLKKSGTPKQAVGAW